MSHIEIHVTMARYSCHEELVNDLSPIFNATKNDEIFFVIDLNTRPNFLYGDFLILVVSAVNFLTAMQIPYGGRFINFHKNSFEVQYASRIDFFKHMQIELPESFIRKPGDGRFTEITSYHNDASALELHNKIIRILKENGNISVDLLAVLDYCIYEILDNVLCHANSPTNGKCVVQFFAASKEIRFLICDTGIGVHTSLTQHPNSKYKHLTKDESIYQCTRKGVTNSEGMGNGLYHTSEFIRRNLGDFILHSDDFVFKISNGIESHYQTTQWKGTYLFIKVLTSNIVDYKDFMGENVDLQDSFEFVFGE
ncbi:MAG: hypothetical protein JSS82_08085 [Bacteroidetes bacterium]|nr:hypothetical protein [Bacteroidota bacterium]